jgi:hypothetical protein
VPPSIIPINNINNVSIGGVKENTNINGMNYSIDNSKPYYYVDEGDLGMNVMMESSSNDRNELRESQ